MEDDQDTTFAPFWLPATPRHHRRSLRRSTSSLIFSSGGFLLLLVAALAFVFVIVPSLHSFTAFMSHIFKPNSVKKSWDSINLVLVLFAVLCGFLGRNATAASAQVEEEVVKSGLLTPRQWYEYSDQTVYNDRGANRMRSSSSYPDLRQDSEAVLAGDERWRSYDDIHVSNYQVVHPGQPVRQQQHCRRASWHEEYTDVTNHMSDYRIPDGGEIRQQQQHRRRASWHDGEFDDVTAALRPKNIPVDTFVIRTEQASSSSSDDSVDPAPVRTPSPPHVAAPPVEPKRIYEAVGKRETINDDFEAKSSSFRQPATAAATQPPPEEAALPENEVNSSQKREKNVKKKKKTGGVATTKQFITSLRRNNNKNKKRQNNIEDFETQLAPAATSCPSPIPPPPPPPPPPPSVFHNLFQSKKSKPTKTHHPIPPSPSPPVFSAARVTSPASILTSPNKPPSPLKLKTFNILEEEAASNSGGESPLPSGIPPPPPLPPFRMQAMRFVQHGDFVRVKSDKSARSSDDEEGGDVSPMASSRSGFCPSPDVNTKADTFIARFRAGLKLEKMNTVNQRGRSNLGLG